MKNIPGLLLTSRGKGSRKFRTKSRTLLLIVVACFVILSGFNVFAACIPTRIMPLGDSNTAGYGEVPTTDFPHMVGYRKVLQENLVAAGYPVDFVGSQNAGHAISGFDYNHEGHGGWSASPIADSVYQWLVANPADVILLHIGTNSPVENTDQVARILTEIDRYEQDYQTQVRVILAQIINRGQYSSVTSSFNNNLYSLAMNRKAAGDLIWLVDMEHAIDYPGDLFDGIHPTGTGYAKMVGVWFSTLREMLFPCAEPKKQPPNGVIEAPARNLTITAGTPVSFSGTGSDPDGNLPLTYRWRFGAGSGIPDATVEDPGLVQFNVPGTYMVTFTVTNSLGLWDTTPATLVITVRSNLPVISHTGWTLHYVDSQELTAENGAAVNSFDGNVNTMWHTDYSGGSPGYPHEIQINLGQTYDMEGFRYLPRQDETMNGWISRYELYVSADGTNWGTPAVTGTFAINSAEKEITFAPKTGQFIRLRALSEVSGNPWASMAEIDVLGSRTNQPPNGVIQTPSVNLTITAGDSVSFSGTGSDPDGNPPLTYLWQFGAGSGIPNATVEDPGPVQFKVHGTYTVSFTVTDSQGLSDPSPATLVITVQNKSIVIPHTGWTLHYVDSQELTAENGAAVNSFDGNVNTIWHTKYSGGSTGYPHEIQINLGQTYTIDGFRYLPRQDGGINGRIAQYELYVSGDGTNWGTAAATGTFASSAAAKQISFAPKTGQFIRLKALSEVNGNPWASMAEIDVLGSLSRVNQPPNGVIETPSTNMTITAGDSVSFSGTGGDPDGNLPLAYLWQFGAGSGIPNATVEDPGPVQFKVPGTYTVSFTVTDSQGLSDPSPATLVITVQNKPQPPNGVIETPSANMTITAGDSVSFSGTGSDPDGNLPLAYLWQFGAGSGIPNAAVEDPGPVQFKVPGTYTVSFTVTDSQGLSDPSPATLVITVQNKPQPPNGVIETPSANMTITAGDSVSFSGTGGDPDGNLPLAYLWQFGAGSGIPNATVEDPGPVQFKVPGTYTVSFTVTDSQGLSDPSPAKLVITVQNKPQPPNGVIETPSTNMTITAGDSVSFSGTGGDPDGNLPLAYLWQFGAGSGIPNATVEDPGPVQFKVPGTYTVSFTVTDSQGLSDPSPATLVITVQNKPQPPNGVIETPSANMTITAGDSVSFSGTGSDPDGNLPLAYLWQFGAGSGIPNAAVEDPGPVQFKVPGTYTVSFTVTDSQGLSDPSPATLVITVQNKPQPPNGVIETPSANMTITAGDSVSFSGTGSDPDGNLPLAYLWQFGAGSGIPNAAVEDPGPVQFKVPGTYTVSFTVTDSQGLSDPSPATLVITVQNKPQPPNGVIETPSANMTITAGDSVSFSGTGSDPDGNLPLAYLWQFGAGSGIPNAAVEDPGPVQFKVPGTYTVSFTVTDSQGLSDPSPATLVITVQNKPQPPNGVIETPSANMTITAGDSVSFSGTGSDPDGNLPLAYLWQFGAGSGILNATVEDPGPVQFKVPGTYTVSFTVTDSQGLSDPSSATLVITVQNKSIVIPHTGWTLHYADSQELTAENGAAVNSFDGNVNTMWHTKYSGGSTGYPHEIQINLGQTYTIDGFRYLPRQDGGINGRIAQYELYVSVDGTNWGTAAATGTFANSAAAKQISFAPKTGQFIRLKALSEVNGNPWASMAEIDVLGSLSGVNQPPNGVIEAPSANMTITAGDSVSFSGTGGDPDGNLPLTHLWQFGAGSGIPGVTVEDPGSVQFKVPGTYTVNFTVTDSQGLSDPSPATLVITVQNKSIVIPHTDWTLHYVDSQELTAENGAAVNSFDGNVNTIWHTKYSGGSTGYPHEIQINLGQTYTIDGFRYLPRQDGGINGRIAQYELYVSVDGKNWGTAAATGTFANSAAAKQISFAPKTGQFIRLKALSEVNGNPWASMAEIDVLGNLYKVQSQTVSTAATYAVKGRPYAYDVDATSVSAITFPVDGNRYNASLWNAGCGTPAAGDVCGAWSNVGTGVQTVQISIQQGASPYKYWNGSAFVSSDEFLFNATGGTGWSSLLAFEAFPTDGDYIIHSQVMDDAGNLKLDSTATFTIDRTGPTVTLTAPVHNSSTNDATPSFSGASGLAPADSETIAVQIYRGTDTSGELVEILTAERNGTTGRYTVDALTLPDGAYTAQAEQPDSVGNVSVSSANTFTIDTAAPSAAITFPAASRFNQAGWAAGCGALSVGGFCGTASQTGAAIQKVEIAIFKVGDKYWSGTAFDSTSEVFVEATGTATWSYGFDFGQFADGSYQVQVRATDTLGKVETGTTVTFVIDGTPPETTILPPIPGEPTTSGRATFHFSSSETGSTFRCRLDGGPFRTCSSGIKYGYSPDALVSAGTHTFQVKAADAAGNLDASPASFTWTIP